jgi:hypothetical protein
MTARPNEFGPLPKVDRNDELQRISFARLGALVPTGRFILRDEGGSDKGVDRSLEILIGGGATNIRAQIQMKGSDSTDLNADGSFSYPVSTSNLNYLLNGTCPLYIIWIEFRDELRYVWARDEATRLCNENPNWQDQKTVTLRFAKIINNAAWDDIHETTIREGRRSRDIHNAIASAVQGDGIVATVNTDSEVVTSEEAHATILLHGIALASSGYAPHVIELGAALNNSHQSQSRVQLVLGYSHYCKGDHITCRGHLAKAQLQRAELTADAACLLDHLLCACDYHFGKISHSEFLSRRAESEKQAPNSFQAQLRFDRLRRQYLASRDASERQSLLEQIKTAHNEILGAETDGPARICFDLMLLYSEAAQSQTELINALTQPQMRAALGLEYLNTPATQSNLIAIRDAISNRSQQLQLIANRAASLKLPALIAESLVVQSVIETIVIYDLVLISRTFGQPAPPPNDEIRARIRSTLERAIELYRVAGSSEGEARAGLLLAQWLDFIGLQSESQLVARNVLAIATAMEYSNHIAEANALLAGCSRYQLLFAETGTRPDPDTLLANATDE